METKLTPNENVEYIYIGLKYKKTNTWSISEVHHMPQ